jgi:indolepyruvate ferredoxin oxidoreductase alpha subunit
MKILLSGNEAIALGAWEAGVQYAAAYPGTPSTEILEKSGALPRRESRVGQQREGGRSTTSSARASAGRGCWPR